MSDELKISDFEYKLDHAQNAIHYQFKNPKLLLAALTHPSASTSHSYERLEFLGDALLEAIVRLRAFEAYPKFDEGKLTNIKIALVSGDNLAEVAERMGLGFSIIFGTTEKNTGNRGMHSALENVYEAIVAAIYLDGGIEPTVEFVDRTIITGIANNMKTAAQFTPDANPKSALQEKLQAQKKAPSYSIIDEFGPAHNKTFVAEVSANGKVLASGSGHTKKEAESAAASSALKQIK
ncbi:MAG: ribonuclease III [Coriobacteriia bacterium]|nr:ribonuclease III [Coriobacteriia bacterium]